MALRVTQQNVEVLADGSGGKLRVTQFYVEVLGTPGSAAGVNDTLSLTQAVVGNADHPRSVTDTISFMQSATETDVPSGMDIPESVSDTLTLTDAAAETIDHVTESVSDTLTLTDEAVPNDELPTKTVSDTLTLGDTAVEVIDHTQSVDDPLSLTDNADATTDLPTNEVDDTLTLTDEADQVIDHATEAVSDTLTLTDEAAEAIDHVTLSVSDTLNFTDEALSNDELPTKTASDTLVLTDLAAETIDHVAISVSDTLSLTDAIVEGFIHTEPVSDTLTFSQTIVTSGDRHASATDTLTLTDAATLPTTFDEATNDLSSLTDSATQTGAPSVSIIDTLSLTETLTNGIIVVSVSDAMTLVQTPYVGQNIIASASSSIAFSQSDVPGIYFASAADVLAFVQVAIGDTPGSLPRFVTDPMSITDEADFLVNEFARSLGGPGGSPDLILALIQSVQVAQPHNIVVADTLALVDLVSEHQFITNITISDLLNLQDVGGRVLFGTAADTLTFTQIAYRQFFADNVLTITDAATGFIAKPLNDNLGLTDSFAKVFIANRLFTDTLALVSSAAVYIADNGVRCQYSPFIGSGSPAIPATMPVLGDAKVTLTYPFVSPTTTLMLRNPQFGNVDRLSFDRINRETRGGTLIMFADPKWPKQQTMNVAFQALTRAMKNSLLTFLAASLGQDIGYLDHENRQWVGIVTTPEATVQNDSRGGYTVTFEFEGVLQ